MDESLRIQRPQRWDKPFSNDMNDADIATIMAMEPFKSMDHASFPRTLSLENIIRNDTRLLICEAGEIVVRAGDYGSSAFMLVSGAMRMVFPPGLSNERLGRRQVARKSLFGLLRQVWDIADHPEMQTQDRFARHGKSEAVFRKHGDGGGVVLQDVKAVLAEHQTERLQSGEMFGVVSALGRFPRILSVFAESKAILMDVRWQGLRDLRRFDAGFRAYLDQLYRERSLQYHLQEEPIYQYLTELQSQEVADHISIESYGEWWDWYATYGRWYGRSAREQFDQEPLICEEGHFADGLILVRSGFARISQRFNHGHRTVGFLGRDRIFGMEEAVHNWLSGEQIPYRFSLRALGHVDVLRLPTLMVERHILPSLQLRGVLKQTTSQYISWDGADEDEVDLLEFLVEHRFINGTAAMLINLDHCVRCDDCVRACAMGHGGNPRFLRHGYRHGAFMVAHACMHCIDPICMIGCPTGAIHRSPYRGEMVINSTTCIGCATCSSSCPYNNIRMVELRNEEGQFILDKETGLPIHKATKCDLCVDQPGGAMCERSCPHAALKRVDMQDLSALRAWIRQ